MAQAKSGDKVRIDYTGVLEDGTVFDSTRESEDGRSEECESEDCGCGSEHGPRELVIGKGEFLPAIEEALIGMSAGERERSSSRQTTHSVSTMEKGFFPYPAATSQKT